ncbi:MAG TPA: IS3 family transposase [Streptosporangiaceae bacterium]|jgi:transposase InsO family protein|nr:IS3 family transposase [Streptosporangiaceae bacterium]
MYPVLGEVERHLPTSIGCRLLGIARASVYRWRAPSLHGPRTEPTAGEQPAALTAAEQAAIVAVLDSDRFADKAPEQVWAILLDEGVYLGSVSTFYRLLRVDGQVRERRAQARHPPRKHPRLLATGPNQVWSWDITKLKGNCRREFFDLYAIMDIFSRKMIHWETHLTETGELASDFIDHAFEANDGVMPNQIHSDNGTSMTSKSVADLLADLHITRSLSRPKVSNDNPYSEAAFKTLKYCPAFPDNFTTLGEAIDFTNIFFPYYNTEHRHSGIGLYTPQSVHDGTWKYIRDDRQAVLDAAYRAHPERFIQGPPHAPKLPTEVWINNPRPKIESSDSHTR